MNFIEQWCKKIGPKIFCDIEARGERFESQCYPAVIYLVKVNDRNTRTRCEICFTSCSSDSIVNFEHVIAGWLIYIASLYLCSIQT